MLPLSWLRPTLPVKKGGGGESLPLSASASASASTSDGEQVLPSFEELQRKTWETLYPPSSSPSVLLSSFQDKSPKGSVDGPIQQLVDLINHHSAICTLSSCSGRISLFDPNERKGRKRRQRPILATHFSKEESSSTVGNTTTTRNDPSTLMEEEEEEENSALPASSLFTEASGKGRGTWVVVSHDLLDPEEMVRAIFSVENKNDDDTDDNDDDDTAQQQQQQQQHHQQQQPWILKFEPMLLHIAARSLAVGQALLQLALECGFRESGLVVTPKRVTVAIRSHSLALGIPLFLPRPFHNKNSNADEDISSALCPSPDFIRALVHECNQRLIQNWNHLERFYLAMEQKWFQLVLHPKIRRIIASTSLPPLRLWNAAAVAIVVPTKDDGAERANYHHAGDYERCIYTFGGYGKGPDPFSTSSSKRSSSIYQLRLPIRDHVICQPASAPAPASANMNNIAWEQVAIQQPEPSMISNDLLCWEGLVDVVTPLFDLPHACQGMAAARLGRWIVLWGGRTSPTQPLDARTIYLFHPPTHQLATVSTRSNSDITTSTQSLPPARWGHCLVPLSGNRLALVGGGRCGELATTTDDENSNVQTMGPPPALEDIYILHYLQDKGYFVWERLPQHVQLTGGRLHAAAATIKKPPRGGVRHHHQTTTTTTTTTSSSSETLVVAGGLQSIPMQQNPLLLFNRQQENSSSSLFWSCEIGATECRLRKDGSSGTYLLQTSAWTTITAAATTTSSALPIEQQQQSSLFGAGLTTLLDGRLAILSGGVWVGDGFSTSTEDSSSEPPLHAYLLQGGSKKNRDSNSSNSTSTSPLTVHRLPLSFENENEQEGGAAFDFGSLVHHTSVALSDTEFALIGGGVTSFAFGETFAQQSYHLEVVLPSSNDKQETNDRATPHPIHPLTRGVAKDDDATADLGQEPTTAILPAASITTKVVYVHPPDAKRVKMELERRGWLDKGVRMITVERRPRPQGLNNNNNNNKEEEVEEEAGHDSSPPPQVLLIRLIAIPIRKDAWLEFHQTFQSFSTASTTEESSSSSSSSSRNASSSFWQSCIQGIGQEEDMPPSTARFASLGNRRSAGNT